MARVCEGGEEGYGNTYETEIVYLKAFLKSLQLLKLEMLLVLLFTFIWNLPQREKKSGTNNNSKEFLEFVLPVPSPARKPLHSSSVSVLLPPETS